jgi:tetratricopeptide (TPR) repeat protein
VVDVAQRLAAALTGRYEVEHEIGRGGMALVFLARDLRHGRRVAVKVLRPDLTAAIGVDRFLREIQIGAGLQHPHIVPLHDSGEAGGLPYYVMAFVEGESLRDRLEREKQLPLDEALRIARDVAEALGHAHSHGVVHRDVKPENILLSSGHAMVADFGVARALSAAAVGVTGTGLAVGTPTYMSPEQAGGMDAVDGRSDLYSLGCVLYEMLVGEPPFTGPTASAILARHMQETVPGVRIVRPSVPPSLERILDTLLAKIPADRYPTATAFLDALARPPADVRPLASRRRRWLAVAVVPALVGSAALAGVLLRPPAPDPLAYLVLPLAHREGAEPTELDGVQSQLRLSDALKRWDQVTVADEFVVSDAARRRGDDPPTHSDWLRMAREMGFGTLVRGEVAQLGDSVVVAVTAYRVPGGRLVTQARAAFVPPADVRRTFERLAAELLGLAPPGDGAAPVGTRSLAAGRAYARGRQALADGDPPLAEARFIEATRADPTFGDAQFWLAQVRVWRGVGMDSVMPAAQRAFDARAELTDERAQALVTALVELAQGRFSEACARYQEVLDRDSTDFAAWFGLAECRARDGAVRRDPGSPSDWSFRSSYHAAGEAYRRGLALAPFLSGSVSERLRQFLYVERGHLRQGWAIPPDTGWFWAYPALAADTIALVPHRSADVQRGAVEAPPTLEAALERNREVLAGVAARWAEVYPRSAAALAAVAANFEELARTGRGAVGVSEALDRVRQARLLDAAPGARVALAHAETRLLIKLGRFEDARRLADSALEATSSPDPGAAPALAALASLLGQPDRAARLLEIAAPALEREFARRGQPAAGVPLQALIAGERLRAYAAVGAPTESLRVLPAEVDSLIRLWAPGRAATLREVLLDEPFIMSFPTVGASPLHRTDSPDYLIRLQARLVAGDAAGVRAALDSLAGPRRGLRQQDVSMGAFYQETWLRLRAGDTAAAVDALDRMFADLSLLSSGVLSDVTNAAALVRALALRAALDPPGGAVGRRWARAVATLWRDAIPDLAPLVRTMQHRGG